MYHTLKFKILGSSKIECYRKIWRIYFSKLILLYENFQIWFLYFLVLPTTNWSSTGNQTLPNCSVNVSCAHKDLKYECVNWSVITDNQYLSQFHMHWLGHIRFAEI